VNDIALDLKDIDYTLNIEHECTLTRLPRSMSPMVIFPYPSGPCQYPYSVSPAKIPPSSDLYDVMYNGAPSAGPTPCSNVCSSFFEISQLWYPTQNKIDPSVAAMRYVGSVH
jgi:hypothetical protein